MRQPASDGTSADRSDAIALLSGVVLFPLDDELVAFSEEAQCLIGLNASAALIVRKLHEGRLVSELAHILVAEGFASPEEAERWVATALDALSLHGMLTDGRAPPTASADKDSRSEAAKIASVRPYATFKPAAERCYRLLETRAVIRFAHVEQRNRVDTVIGHLATQHGGSTPNTVIEICCSPLDDGHLRSDFYRDQNPIGYAPRLSMLGPMIKAVLWQTAINAHDFLFYIHAGVVGTRETCIMLPAASGSGKSALTAALAHSGFRYFSDEVALIQRTTFRVPPMPLAICIKSTGWDLMSRYFPNLKQLPVHTREDGRKVRYVPPPRSAAEQPSAPASHIIFPKFTEDGPATIARLTRSAALGLLMKECLALRPRLDQVRVEAILRWLSGIDCYAMRYSNLDEAVALVRQVVRPENT